MCRRDASPKNKKDQIPGAIVKFTNTFVNELTNAFVNEPNKLSRNSNLFENEIRIPSEYDETT